MGNTSTDSRFLQIFHQTSKTQPEDYQECLVYSPCEGFMIATWKQLNEDPARVLSIRNLRSNASRPDLVLG